MQALLWDGALKYRADYPVPEPSPDEALVRVTLAGICNTDLEITRGYANFRGVMGHEFVGVVERSDRRDLVGKRVVGEINAACGSCRWCAAGLGRHCPSRTVLGIVGRDGAFAEYLVLPAVNLVEVPEGVSDRQAVFAEPLAACFEVPEQVHVEPGWRVAVLGDGKLGLLMAQVAALLGCEVTAVGRHPEKLAVLGRRGITTTSPAELDGGAFDLVVECTGTAEGLAYAGGLARPRGTVVLKSTVAGTSEITLAPFVVNEITVVGSRCGPFGPALRALERGAVDVESLIAAEFPLSRGEEALALAGLRGTLKVLLRP